jgi:spermidine/putrescine transport system substrate-binding protein
MHPRERWSEDGPARPGLSRRSFLQTSAGAGLLAGGLGPLLAACSSGAPATGASGATAIPLPRPNNPVTWPVFKDNPTIKSGLQPEQGTLKIYNWVAYINQQCLKDFAKKYNVPVPQVTTFNNTDEALAKLRSGQVSFDIFFPTIDLMGQLVYGKLIQPLNHSYIPNISQAWSDFTNPFYDGKWRYTVPYTIYTTGISWRKDHVPENPYTMANPWAMLWQPKYKGKVG